MVGGEGSLGWFIPSTSLLVFAAGQVWSVPWVPWAGDHQGVALSSGLLRFALNPARGPGHLLLVVQSLHSVDVLFQLWIHACPLASLYHCILTQDHMGTSGFHVCQVQALGSQKVYFRAPQQLSQSGQPTWQWCRIAQVSVHMQALEGGESGIEMLLVCSQEGKEQAPLLWGISRAGSMRSQGYMYLTSFLIFFFCIFHFLLLPGPEQLQISSPSR